MTTRNRAIIEARAAGRSLQDVAAEFGVSFQHVSRIVRDDAQRRRVEELEDRVLELELLLRDALGRLAARQSPPTPRARGGSGRLSRVG